MPTPAKSYWIISAALLLWNSMGVVAYIMQGTMDLAELAKTDPYQAKAFLEMPPWAWGAYAIAVFAGTGGAIGLLLRRRWSRALFALSLVGVVLQFGRVFLMTDILAYKGWSATIFPAVILVIALFQLWYARKQAEAGRVS